MRYVVGIDAGGTKTVGLLADEGGNVVAEARGSGANLQTHGELEVEKVFHGIMETLTDRHDASAVCLGIAGVDRPRDEAVIRGILRRLGHRETSRVVNDAVIGLVAGAPDGIGVVLLAGTGSIAYGADPGGRSVRAGGYGFVLADEGSGYWFGHQALRAVVRAVDRRGPETLLQPLIFDHLQVRTVEELIPLVYVRGLPKHRVASLASFVQKAADEGDLVASGLLDQGAHELGLIVRAVETRLSFDQPFPLVLAGGVFKGCPSLVDRLESVLSVPLARPALLRAEPARGAVTLALGILGIPPSSTRGDS